MVNKVSFHGTEYNSPDETSPAIRDAYQRALDLAKEGSTGGLHTNFKLKVSTRMRFAHDGKVYDSIDAMPPEVRRSTRRPWARSTKIIMACLISSRERTLRLPPQG